MAEDIVKHNLSALVDAWIEADCRCGSLLESLGNPSGEFMFLFMLAALSKINAAARGAETFSELHSVRHCLDRIEKLRRETPLHTEIAHDIVIEMSDAVRCSIFHSWQIIQNESNKSDKGCVYFLLNPATNLVKIGWTTCLYERARTLETHSGSKLILLGFFFAESCKSESDIHRKFKHLREEGEWFTYSSDLKAFIKDKFG